MSNEKNTKTTFVLHKPKNNNETQLFLEEDCTDGSINLRAKNYQGTKQLILDFYKGRGRRLSCITPLAFLKTDRHGRLKVGKDT